MENQRTFIDAHHKEGELKVKQDILSALTLPEKGILWHKSEGEYIFFSTENRNTFFEKMKEKSGMTPNQFKYSKKGRDFVRDLSAKGVPIITKQHLLRIEGGIFKILPEGKCRVEICV
ncbi:MAG: hypothetical protein NTY80_02270 [candidate division SR1 bacterium]|nr:hypothetical protein [candidate division SR1 bacterium]